MSRIARSGSTTPRSGSARAWRAEAAACAVEVSDTPQLWVAGGLAWAATAAPIALLVAVVPAPGSADLTFIGSRAFTSSLWPWNVVALGIGALVLSVAALALVALGEAGLRAGGVAMSVRRVLRAVAVTIVVALPVAVVAGVAALVGAAIARDAFVAPGGDPLLRTLAGAAAALAVLGAVALASAAAAAVARVAVLDRGAGVGRALATTPGLLVRCAPASVIHALATVVAGLAYLVVATLLLAVLWAPIGAELAEGAEFDAPLAILLVGFVAIWLCLVLGGGALRAWGSMTWTRLLATASWPAEVGPAETKETPSNQ